MTSSHNLVKRSNQKPNQRLTVEPNMLQDQLMMMEVVVLTPQERHTSSKKQSQETLIGMKQLKEQLSRVFLLVSSNSQPKLLSNVEEPLKLSLSPKLVVKNYTKRSNNSTLMNIRIVSLLMLSNPSRDMILLKLLSKLFHQL